MTQKGMTFGSSPTSRRQVFAIGAAVCLLAPFIRAESPREKVLDAQTGLKIVVKTIGPATESADLQIICILKHDPSGDKYIEAVKDFNDKLGGLVASLRDRGDFVGEPGETLLFTPPGNTIAPSRVLLIGVGEESALSLDNLRLAGRVAAREAVRLGAKHVAFAPTLRDQGSTRIDVADGDAAVVEQFLLAYDTQRRLRAEGLSPMEEITDFTIEAGPKYFDTTAEKVILAVASAAHRIKQRDSGPFHRGGTAK